MMLQNPIRRVATLVLAASLAVLLVTPLPSLAPTPVPSADGSSTGSGSDVLSRRNRPPDPL